MTNASTDLDKADKSPYFLKHKDTSHIMITVYKDVVITLISFLVSITTQTIKSIVVQGYKRVCSTFCPFDYVPSYAESKAYLG